MKLQSEKKWYQFWKRNNVSEVNSAVTQDDHIHEFNTSLESAYINMLCGSSESPYTIQEIRAFTKNPMSHIAELRKMAKWAYRTNGVVSGAIDYMKSMHTLDGVIVSKSRRPNGQKPRNYRANKIKMESTLNTIRYKQIIRDGIFKNANDGMYVAYFETAATTPDYRMALTDYEIQNITEINTLGINAMVIPLPVDYVRIIGRKNNSYVVAFDLRYFDYFTDDARKKKLAGFPKEIQEGWMKKNNGEFDGSWLVLDNTKTIVTKIKSEISDPYLSLIHI